jgi:hypothetical protein
MINFIFLIFTPLLFLFNFYSVGKILVKKRDISEQIIFGFTLYILILNYFFFYIDLDIYFILIFFLGFSFLSLAEIIFRKKKKIYFNKFFFNFIIN